jgi:hypothetical protein
MFPLLWIICLCTTTNSANEFHILTFKILYRVPTSCQWLYPLTYVNDDVQTDTLWIFICLFIYFLASVSLITVCAERYCCSWSHSMTHTQLVGLPLTRDRPFAETSTWQHTTLTINIHDHGWIWTRNASIPLARERRLRPGGHRDWLICESLMEFKGLPIQQ